MIPISSPEDFQASDIPTDPGVYLYRDDAGEIIYVGKAKSLRNRVKSYFLNKDQPAKTRQLVLHIRSIDWVIVNNEVEALLLENKLIKQHTPKYNINLKDAKTYAYISLTREPFPRILTSRKVSRKLESFGPYTDGYTRQDLQRLTTKVYKLRTCKNLHKRACLNYHIHQCSAPLRRKSNPRTIHRTSAASKGLPGRQLRNNTQNAKRENGGCLQSNAVRNRLGDA